MANSTITNGETKWNSNTFAKISNCWVKHRVLQACTPFCVIKPRYSTWLLLCTKYIADLQAHKLWACRSAISSAQHIAQCKNQISLWNIHKPLMLWPQNQSVLLPFKIGTDISLKGKGEQKKRILPLTIFASRQNVLDPVKPMQTQQNPWIVSCLYHPPELVYW